MAIIHFCEYIASHGQRAVQNSLFPLHLYPFWQQHDSNSRQTFDYQGRVIHRGSYMPSLVFN